jgi:hypothetical protein
MQIILYIPALKYITDPDDSVAVYELNSNKDHLLRWLDVQEMLEMSCVEFWRYSNITCCGYPLGTVL